jgi:hypothetical protein
LSKCKESLLEAQAQLNALVLEVETLSQRRANSEAEERLVTTSTPQSGSGDSGPRSGSQPPLINQLFDPGKDSGVSDAVTTARSLASKPVKENEDERGAIPKMREDLLWEDARFWDSTLTGITQDDLNSDDDDGRLDLDYLPTRSPSPNSSPLPVGSTFLRPPVFDDPLSERLRLRSLSYCSEY